MATFNQRNYTITYSVSKLPGCCGVAVVHSVRFEPKREGVTEKQKYNMYKGFLGHLRYNRHDIFDLERCKMVMSDRVRPKGSPPSIYEFCTYTDWYTSPAVYNPKSGNKVQVFELDR